ncbi:hypothetical protein FW778_03355 [Ginsengibacter hankyongi]|uniref:Uncharacterized protein n=1 Tax=Ginsengibacter hankyongi TaxID=2607284 RepID=A0A5J5IJX0_9BACT|nr:hypothetical protein [Ginsengibacter hankyongi]KAA9041091.1 hypothetical protein FW778_03355 [Ginsengibacter hankyongi]
MDTDNKIQSRKKFIGLGISAAALFTAFKFWVPKRKKETKTVKMLTQDGKLVEVDIAALSPKKKKITNKELQNWIKK